MLVEPNTLAAFGPALLVRAVAAVTFTNIREGGVDQGWVTHTHEDIETLPAIESAA